jgi:dTDP-4-dehydrorhamnose 3,5-epimerase-like enzyme
MPTFTDKRGILTAVEKVPFEIKRVFWIYDAKLPRGQHSHRRGEQLIVAVYGSFTVKVCMGEEQFLWKLQSPKFGVYLPPNAWVELNNWSEGAVALVLCSEYYNSEDIERGNGMSENGGAECES